MKTVERALPENGHAILYFLLAGLALAVGTPAFLALTRPGARFYLLQTTILTVQAVPYVVAAALWLPWRSARANRIGLVLARVLFLADLVLYVPILTGWLPTGGDMIALGFFVIALVTTASVLVVTPVAFVISWALHRNSPVTSSVPPLE